ncbi:MAG: DMT family transporter [Bacteroidota bacterium]
MPARLGETAGLLTSLFFAINSVFITRAGQRVGAVVSNRTRVLFALLYLILLNILLYRQPLAFDAEPAHWGWLSLSGIIGLALGDALLFESYLSVGPRLGNLLLSLSPVFAALEAWLFIGERLGTWQVLGMLLALGGIVWVLLERRDRREPLPQHVTAGILLGVLSALCQATGFLFSRRGLYDGFPPIQGNAIRMLAAAVILIVIALFQRQVGPTLGTLRANPDALRLLMLAAFVGPVVGVSLSLFAVQNAQVGVASTLTSLTPVFMLPISVLVFKERLNWQAVLGTLVAMLGVAVLFLAG